MASATTRRDPAWRVLAVAAVAAVAAGVVGAVMALVLRGVQHVAFGGGSGVATGIDTAPAWRRVLLPTLGGLLAGLGWWALRRRARVVSVAESMRAGRALRLLPTMIDAGLQLLIVGAGASIGREGAPRQGAAAVADRLARRAGLGEHWRRSIVAAAAGAGLAAVYNVPLTGAVFAVEVIGAPITPAGIALAVVMSGVATVVAWPVVSPHPAYAFAAEPAALPLLGFALLAGPVAWALGRGFRALTGWARHHPAPDDWRLPAATTAAGLALGLSALALPTAAGNGTAVLADAFSAAPSPIWLFALMVVAKPLLTALFLGAGARGGLLTPALATGGALGAGVGIATGLPGAPAAFALVAAAGVLATAERAPLFALAFAWELTHSSPLVAAAIAVCCTAAWATGRGARALSRARPAPPPRR